MLYPYYTDEQRHMIVTVVSMTVNKIGEDAGNLKCGKELSWFEPTTIVSLSPHFFARLYQVLDNPFDVALCSFKHLVITGEWHVVKRHAERRRIRFGLHIKRVRREWDQHALVLWKTWEGQSGGQLGKVGDVKILFGFLSMMFAYLWT